MLMHWIDWAIMIGCIVVLRFISLSTRRYMRGVADFLSANRSAGRYLLTIAGQMGGCGAISIIAVFQMYYKAGFTPLWWGFIGIPLGIILTLSGWVFYRLRETRALTLAQFLEMRYTRRFRIFAGILVWACGVINFGIFPAVAAKFFVYFCGLPQVFHVPGIPWAIPTFIPVMAIDLALALTFVNMGGQISVMVTECAQGMVAVFAFLIIVGTTLILVPWDKIVQGLNTAPVNASMLHPFLTSGVKDYNIWYFLIGYFGSIYAANSWQGCSGFQSAGKSAHEMKMGGIIGLWRGIPLSLLIIVLPVAGFAVMNLSDYADTAAKVKGILSQIPNRNIQEEMRVPIALSFVLPIGIKGLLATVMMFFSFTCHDTYMHSWGTIFIQDVVMPFRARPLPPEQHVKWLRWSIIGVAVFGFLFSALYPPGEDILMFFAITGTIWAGGSGAVIVGGMYWRRGTTGAAYACLVLGAIIGVSGLIVPKWYHARTGVEFPINGQWLWFLAMIEAIVVYVVVSLLTRSHWKRRAAIAALVTAGITVGAALLGVGVLARISPWIAAWYTSQGAIIQSVAVIWCISLVYMFACLAICRGGQEFNLEKMLKRGKYRVAADHQLVEQKPTLWQRLVGIGPEFTFTDKILAIALLTWQFGWFTCFVTVSLYHAFVGLDPAWWGKFWHFYILFQFFIAIPAVIWFTIGGIFDIKALFHTLATAVRDHTDDGSVRHEADDVLPPVPCGHCGKEIPGHIRDVCPHCRTPMPAPSK